MDNSACLPLVNSYVEKWAREQPDSVAMFQHEDGRQVTCETFATIIDFFALRLLDLGLENGSRVATQQVLLPEHMALMYACFKIGAIIAPLDVRLCEDEVVRDINKFSAEAFFFLGDTPVRDFRKVGQAVSRGCPSVKHLVQFTPNPQPGDIITGPCWARANRRQPIDREKAMGYYAQNLDGGNSRRGLSEKSI